MYIWYANQNDTGLNSSVSVSFSLFKMVSCLLWNYWPF